MQRQALERVRSLPGLQAAALTAHAPLTSGEGGGKGVLIQGDAPKTATQAPIVLTTSISLDYFRTMETRLLQGRDFTAQDDAPNTPVAIVNEAFDTAANNGDLKEMNAAFKAARKVDPSLRYADYLNGQKTGMLDALF